MIWKVFKMKSIYNLKGKININKKHWYHFIKTNCYAYALGLDINEDRIMKKAYQPGVISDYYL